MHRLAPFEEFPILVTKRLVLRQITAADTQIIYEIFSDPEVTRYYDVETFTNQEDARQLIRWCTNLFENQDGIRWGISGRQSNNLMGTCGFHNWNKSYRKAEMGYELGIQHWGQGFATEAVTRIIEFGFNQFEFNRIEAWAMLENRTSMRILQKVGFHEEGVLRDYGYWQGGFHDVLMFSFLKREWDERVS